MRLVIYLSSVFFIFISCSKFKPSKLNDVFIKDWNEKTHLCIENKKCNFFLKKRVNQINNFNLRKKALDKIFNKVKEIKSDSIFIEENFFNHGITYNFSFFSNNKMYSINFESDHIVSFIEKENVTIVFPHSQYDICDDKLLKTEGLTTINISSLIIKKEGVNKIEKILIR